MKTKKTKSILTLTGVAMLAAWGVSGLIGTNTPCLSSNNVTVEGEWYQSTELRVKVTGYVNGSQTTLCNNLAEGQTCVLQLSRNTGNSLSVYFDQNGGQFAYYSASGNRLNALSNQAIAQGQRFGFVAVGASNSIAYVEGDPTIQLMSGTCG